MAEGGGLLMRAHRPIPPRPASYQTVRVSAALPSVHPGEILADELEALGMSKRKFAKHIGVPTNAVTAIVKGQRGSGSGISAEMAIRLSRAFGTSERYWMNLQRNYDAKLARAAMAEKAAMIRPLVNDRWGEALHAGAPSTTAGTRIDSRRAGS